MTTAGKQVVAIVLTIAIALLVWQLVDILLLVFGAILLATVLRSFGDLIERWTPLHGKWALGLAVAVLVGFFGVAGWLFGSEIRSQGEELRDTLPGAWDAFQKRFGDAPWFTAVEDRLADVTGMYGKVLAGARWAATSMVTVIAHVLLIVFGGLYIAGQPDLYRRGLIVLFPPHSRERVSEAMRDCGGALRLWLLGQLASMVIVGVLTGVGLWLVGLPSPFVLGLLAGLAEFVPIVGPILAAIPGLLVAASHDAEMMLWVLAVYVAVQQIESYAIMPIVQRKAVSLPPALTLFAVVAMGVLLGPLGLLFATPLTVVAYVLVKKLYLVETLHEQTRIPGAGGK